MKLINHLWLVLLITITGCAEKKEALTLEQKAAEIHNKVLTIDTHADTPYDLTYNELDIGIRNDPYQNGSKIDFPRMKEGGLDAVFFAVYVAQKPRTKKNNEDAKKKALELFDMIHQTIDKNPGLAEFASTPDDAYRIEKIGKRAIYIGIENGFALGKDLSLLKTYYDLGARYITLCHSKNNDICDSSTDKGGPEYNGLSKFGEKVVKEMNKLGIMVDVSHASDETFYDVIALSEAPVIASHSCARNLCDHKRNMNDDMIKKLAARNGVIQVCLVADFVKKMPDNPARDSAYAVYKAKWDKFEDLSEKQEKQKFNDYHTLNKKYPKNLPTVSDFVDHIDHVVKTAGINHVGIGTDFDGGGALKDCCHVAEIGNITLELVRRGYSEDDIRKIWGGNLMRVFREVEKAKSN